jgi:hypothetical protein
MKECFNDDDDGDEDEDNLIQSRRAAALSLITMQREGRSDLT